MSMVVSRRAWLAGAAASVAFALDFLSIAAAEGRLPPKSPCGIASTAMGMHLRGGDGLGPVLRDDPVAYLDVCRSLGAGGVQHAVDRDLKRFRTRLEQLGMYYEGEARLPATIDADTAEFERSIANAAELGATCVRAVSRPPVGSTGRRYESFASYAQYREWQATADAIVLRCLPIAERYKVAIALENHKDRRVEEHVAFLASTASAYLGALVDPGNNMTFMERPVETVTLLAPYAKACSLKDMGVAPYSDGFLLSEVRFGTGMSDQRALFAILRRHNPRINAVTELITRDPLEVPVLTAEYRRSLPDIAAKEAAWMAMVKARSTALPIVSTLSPAQQYQREADNNRSVFTWGRTHIPRA